MARDLCIAVAVSKPESLDPVAGAIPSARRLLAWAQAIGYDTELVTDEDPAVPVTCARLREIFARKLGQGGQRRLIVSFAGHGLIRGGAEECWLLNGWRTQATEAVNYLKLRDRLGTYRPQQLAVVSDACRSLPTPQAKWVEGNGVVDIKDYVEKPVQIAHLAATRAAQPAFATPPNAAEAYCFFTHVLVNALCGDPASAVENDPNYGRVVTNDRLLTTVERELPLLASRHSCSQTPDLQGGWRSPEHIWSVLSQMQAATVPVFTAPSTVSEPPVQVKEIGAEETPITGETAATAQALAFANTLRAEDRATHFETGCGLVITGVPVVQLEVGPHFRSEADSENPGWFRLYPDADHATPVLARLATGDWVGAAAYRDFIGTFTVGAAGAESYVLRRPYQAEAGGEFTIARAATGSLLTDPFGLAAKLRDGKHDDPVLGALAAYAYARAGAVDEVRRMTFFYGYYSQPAPFDAVLLARVPIERDATGYWADIPAVPTRDCRSPSECARAWTYEATPSIRVRVGGGFPWLRQGWALLEDDFRPEFRKLARYAGALRPSTFTTLAPEAGEELASKVKRGEL